MQVVRAGPDVHGHQGPEVHDAEAVGVNGAFGLLGHEVVHHAKEAGGEEKPDRVVAVPPLHHGVHGAGVGRVGLGQAHRNGRTVDDVKHGDRENEPAEKPVGNVDVAHLAFGDGAEEHDGIAHPDHRNQQIDGPLELGVFLGGGHAQGQGDGRQHDHRLPAPEGEGRQLVGNQPHLSGALHHIVRGRKQRAAPERENHRVGVQRTQAPEAGPGQVEIENREGELGGDKDANQHPHDTPHDRHDGKLANDLVVVGRVLQCSVEFTHVLFPLSVMSGRSPAR